MSGCKVTGDEYEFVLEEPGYKSFDAGAIEGNKVHGSFHDTNHTEETYAATRAPNLTGTWSAVYRCEVGCPGEEFPATDKLRQTEGSNKVTGANEGESISGTLTGDTLELHSSTGGYEANATLTVSADGRSWSGPLQDSRGTSGTYTATKPRHPPPRPRRGRAQLPGQGALTSPANVGRRIALPRPRAAGCGARG
jgi:hypothetical protein